MMTQSPVDAIRAAAHQLREDPLFPFLNHGQAIEVVVALRTTALSWNAFSAQPQPLLNPATFDDAFAAVGRGQRRIAALGHPLEDRGSRSWLALEALAIVCGQETAEDLLWSLYACLPVGEQVKLATFDAEQKAMRPVGADNRMPFEMVLAMLSFPKDRGSPYPWDTREALALQLGFSTDDAALIRAVQRESMQHTWPLSCWFLVGVLDPDMHAFMAELRADPTWREQFEELYAADGHR